MLREVALVALQLPPYTAGFARPIEEALRAVHPERETRQIAINLKTNDYLPLRQYSVALYYIHHIQ